MIRANSQLNQRIINNLLWFIASLGLAIFVWLIAATQSDPIGTQEFDRIRVVAQADDGLQVVSTIEPVTVTVRAPQSVLSVLRTRTSEIVVTADLHGLGAGRHDNVGLNVSILRSQAIGETSAVIASVVLEEIQSKLVSIEPIIDANLPPDYEYGNIELETVEVQVTGASSAVNRVNEAQIRIVLRDQRATFSADYSIVLVDVDGNVVNGVTADPTTTNANVTINRSSDVRAVSIVPDIEADTLPEGYIFNGVEYAPQSVFVRGDLDAMPDVLYTQSIDLTNRTEGFEARVAVLSPGDEFLILGDGRVTVTVNISPATVRQQFENVPVVAIGTDPDLSTRIAPETVSVLINVPQADADLISIEDIRIVVDVTNLTVDTYELEPIVTINVGNIPEESISVLPATISVTISEPTESTAEPSD